MNLELVVIFLIFILSYILILKDFKKSIYLLLILSLLLHKELFSFYRWDLMPVRAFMVSLTFATLTKLIFYLYRCFIKKTKPNLSYIKDPFIVLIIVLWAVRAVSILFTKNLQASLLLFAFFTTIVFLVVNLINFLKQNPLQIEKYLKFYIFLAFLLTLFGYFQYYLYITTNTIIGAFWNIPGNIARVGATFWDINHYGAFLAVILPLSGIFALFEKSFKYKIIFFIFSTSIFITLFLTNSRTAWIIDIVGVLIFLTIFLLKKFGKKSVLYFFISLMILSIPLVVEYNNRDSKFRAEIRQFFHYRMDSFSAHLMLLIGSYQVFSEFPVLGGGYGGFFEHFTTTKIAPTLFGRDPAALTTRVPAHTIWGELLAETGIIGFSLWVLIFLLVSVVLIKATFSTKDFKTFMLSNAMFSVFIGWMTAGIFYSYNAEFFWILLVFFFTYAVGVLKQSYNLESIFRYVSKLNSLPLIVLSIIAFLMIFTNIWSNDLVPWDEAIYAKISKNMVVNKEYIFQTWKLNSFWYEKPPLFMWFMAFFMNFIGFNSLSAKLPSAIFGFLTVIITYIFAKKLFNRFVGFMAGFSLLTTMHFLYYSRMAMTDITNLFFITSSVYFYYQAKSNNLFKHYLFSGVFIGLAVMTKGVVGLVPFGIIGLYEVYLFISKQQKVSTNLLKKYLLLSITCVLVFLPWHLTMFIKFGNNFINEYIGYHVITRATESIENKGQPFNWYLLVIRVSMRIWFVALLASLPYFLYKIFYDLKNFRKNIIELNKLVFLSIWALFILVFFSVAKSKLVWYILPIYPSLSIIIGLFSYFIANTISSKITFINSHFQKFIYVFIVVIITFLYMFYNLGLYYPSNDTGPIARLLKLKDTNLGTENKIFVDRVELPLVMFYTDSEFEIIDYHPQKGRFPVVAYDKPTIVLAKRGRYEIEILKVNNQKKVVGEEKDWVLFYLDSQKEYDKDMLNFINKSLQDTNLSNTKIQDFLDQKEKLIKNLNFTIK